MVFISSRGLYCGQKGSFSGQSNLARNPRPPKLYPFQEAIQARVQASDAVNSACALTFVLMDPAVFSSYGDERSSLEATSKHPLARRRMHELRMETGRKPDARTFLLAAELILNSRDDTPDPPPNPPPNSPSGQ